MLVYSFLKVCFNSILKEESIEYPDSYCPNCKRSKRTMDLLDILRYLFYRIKRRYCNAKISQRYHFIELFNGVLYLILYLRFGLTFTFGAYAILASVLLIISAIDYDIQMIPDEFIVFGFIIGFIYKVVVMWNYNTPVGVWDSLVGLLIGGGFFLLIAIISNGGMGGGDIKLMAMLGFWLGWQGTLLLILLSFVTGGIFSLLLIASKIKGSKDAISFGPLIAIAAFITICWRVEIIYWCFK
jgi:leader peptidase (prepilin peptidase)/N-methyltransferase